MPQFEPRDYIGVVRQIASAFISSINNANEYGQLDKIESALEKFNTEAKKNINLITQLPDIHEYISTLLKKGDKLKRTCRMSMSDSDNEELAREKRKIFQWFNEQEMVVIEMFNR